MDDLDQPLGFWARLKRWFSRPESQSTTSHSIVQVRRSIFRPWRRNESEIAELRKNFETVTQLLVGLRDHLEQQSHQQEELAQQLAKFSDTSTGLPDGTRTPDEAVRAIAQQMAYQSQQQNRLGNILEKISDASGEQGHALHNLVDKTESLEHHAQLTSENVQSMGIVIQTVNRNSEQNGQSLSAMSERIDQHSQMHDLVYRQTGRLMIVLIVTLAIAITALIIVIVIGCMILHRQRMDRPAPPVTPTAYIIRAADVRV